MDTRNEAPEAVLARLGLRGATPLGQGGEAWVYALDGERVARIGRSPTLRDRFDRRAALLEEIAGDAGALTFEIPQIIERRTVGGLPVDIERRLAGEEMEHLLPRLRRRSRDRLIVSYLEATARIGDLRIAAGGFGEVLADPEDRHPTFHHWLVARLEGNLHGAGRPFDTLDPAALALGVPADGPGELVHFDVFPRNVLASRGRVTAILDFGTLSVRGDRRLDVLAAVVYLESAFSRTVDDEDRAVARRWLADRGLLDRLEPTRRWLAAYWSAVHQLPRLREWAHEVLFGD